MRSGLRLKAWITFSGVSIDGEPHVPARLVALSQPKGGSCSPSALQIIAPLHETFSVTVNGACFLNITSGVRLPEWTNFSGVSIVCYQWKPNPLILGDAISTVNAIGKCG